MPHSLRDSAQRLPNPRMSAGTRRLRVVPQPPSGQHDQRGGCQDRDCRPDEQIRRRHRGHAHGQRHRRSEVPSLGAASVRTSSFRPHGAQLPPGRARRDGRRFCDRRPGPRPGLAFCAHGTTSDFRSAQKWRPAAVSQRHNQLLGASRTPVVPCHSACTGRSQPQRRPPRGFACVARNDVPVDRVTSPSRTSHDC